MRRHPYRTPVAPVVTSPVPHGSALDLGLPLLVCAFCAIPAVTSALRDGSLSVEGSFALVIIGGVLGVARDEWRCARRASAAGEG